MCRNRPPPKTEPSKSRSPYQPCPSPQSRRKDWEKEASATATDIPSIPEPPCQRSLNRLPHSTQGQGTCVGQASFRRATGTAAENPQRQR